MIVIIGSGIIGLFIANELLKSGKKVTILDLKKIKASATSAAVGMLAPLIESKPYEKELFDLMLDSKALWDQKYDERKCKIIGLKNNSSILVAQDFDDLEEIQFI